MDNRADNLQQMFLSAKGNEIYHRIFEFSQKEHIFQILEKGVLVGLSGGPDSCFLLAFLCEYKRRECKEFPVVAVHVNHMIRDEESLRDETFSREYASNLNIEFLAGKINVPSISKTHKIGIEEAARNARYSFFADIINGRNDINSIAVAHNATDNLETIIFNMLRGCGLTGLCGIKPVRDNIIRPLLCVTKSEIVDLLNSCNIPYVIDSSNFSDVYTRNHIRNNILPEFRKISDNPEMSIYKMSQILLNDLDYINSSADKILSNVFNATLDINLLRCAHPAVSSNALSRFIFDETKNKPTEKNISAIMELLTRDNFSVSVPGEYNFVCERGICKLLLKKPQYCSDSLIFPLKSGENILKGTNLVIYIGDFDKTFLNVYNFSIQVDLPSDIIEGGLYVRFKKDGDAYRYNGITHKIKKVFNDKNIPASERCRIPILCDSQGIVYVPGLGVRDHLNENANKKISVTFVYSVNCSDDITELFDANLRVRQELK